MIESQIGEDKSAFVRRAMSDPEIYQSIPNSNERMGFCNLMWERHLLQAELDEVEQKILENRIEIARIDFELGDVPTNN